MGTAPRMTGGTTGQESAYARSGAPLEPPPSTRSSRRGFHQHDLRRRRVTTWLGEGEKPVDVKEAMGHSNLRVTTSYTHLSREHLKALVQSPAPSPGQAARGRPGAASA
jgi:integrase